MTKILVKLLVTAFLSICLLQNCKCEAVNNDPGITARIINGDEVTPHSMPFVVAIRTQINGNNVLCGGTLLETTIVLTAARCLDGAEEVEVSLGAHNLDDPNEVQQILQSTQVVIHELYNATTGRNDIGLIILPTVVDLNANIALVTLPQTSDIFNSYTGELGTVVGWGKTVDSSPETSGVLRKADLTIISSLTCTLAYLLQLGNGQMCTTGMHEANICLGDSGGPLVVDGVQVGIASFGSAFGCAVGLPGVYTRITTYLSWLYNTREMYTSLS